MIIETIRSNTEKEEKAVSLYEQIYQGKQMVGGERNGREERKENRIGVGEISLHSFA